MGDWRREAGVERREAEGELIFLITKSIHRPLHSLTFQRPYTFRSFGFHLLILSTTRNPTSYHLNFSLDLVIDQQGPIIE